MHAVVQKTHFFDAIEPKYRDHRCDCVFDLYGDNNTALAFVGGLLRNSSNKNQTLPSVDHIVEELRSCSARRLEYLAWDDIIYQKMKNGDHQDIDLWETIFDLSVWEGEEEKLMLFEKAVNFSFVKEWLPCGTRQWFWKPFFLYPSLDGVSVTVKFLTKLRSAYNV